MLSIIELIDWEKCYLLSNYLGKIINHTKFEYLTKTFNWSWQTWTERYRWLIHVLSWGVPLVVFTVGYSLERFGYNHCGGYIRLCWIRPRHGDRRWQLLLWQLFGGKSWEIISYILVLVLYLSVKYKLKRFVSNIAYRCTACWINIKAFCVLSCRPSESWSAMIIALVQKRRVIENTLNRCILYAIEPLHSFN